MQAWRGVVLWGWVLRQHPAGCCGWCCGFANTQIHRTSLLAPRRGCHEAWTHSCCTCKSSVFEFDPRVYSHNNVGATRHRDAAHGGCDGGGARRAPPQGEQRAQTDILSRGPGGRTPPAPSALPPQLPQGGGGQELRARTERGAGPMRHLCYYRLWPHAPCQRPTITVHRGTCRPCCRRGSSRAARSCAWWPQAPRRT